MSIKTTHTCTISCDHEGCENYVLLEKRPSVQEAQLRAEIDLGWQVEEAMGLHFCPEHKVPGRFDIPH